MALSVQMDVDEFFNMLFDKQEDFLRATPFSNLLRIFFGGVNVNQMISKNPEVPYVGEREEGWFTVGVDVKNKKNLEEALSAYCSGEMLEGDNQYYVEDFDCKVVSLLSFFLCVSKNNRWCSKVPSAPTGGRPASRVHQGPAQQPHLPPQALRV